MHTIRLEIKKKIILGVGPFDLRTIRVRPLVFCVPVLP